jgi:hypothetical protein
MTTEQQDWKDDAWRRSQQDRDADRSGLFELVHATTKGDFRETWTEEQIISVHSSELGAYKAGLKSGYVVRPLKVAD